MIHLAAQRSQLQAIMDPSDPSGYFEQLKHLFEPPYCSHVLVSAMKMCREYGFELYLE